MGNQSKEERVGELALQKSQKIQLQNHKTGWNALRRLWGHPEHQKALRLMGYAVRCQVHVPLDFSHQHFDLENGSKGTMPVLISEWRRVGIQKEPLQTRTRRATLCSNLFTGLFRKKNVAIW